MGKAELAMTPLQQWGEEVEDGAIYSIILQRVRAEPLAKRSCHLDDHSPPECPFVQYRTCKRRVLRAATLPRLVKWLASGNVEGDCDCIPDFLATYQAFATPAQVLELLLPLGPEKAVLQMLELWLKDHPEDFWEPPEHSSLQKTFHFLQHSAPDSPACALAEELLQTHQKEREEGDVRRPEAKMSPDGRNSSWTMVILEMGLVPVTGETPRGYEETPTLLSFSVDEVAEQLTLMDANLFRAVRLFHCLGCVWSQRDKKENQHIAPSVRATVAQFNAVTSCVIASVLGDLSLRIPQRAQLLEKWINIAQKCRVLRNFSSLHAILSALQSNPIYRLKRTWAAVNRDTRGAFRKLSQIFSEDNNHLNCREILIQEGGTQGLCDGRNSPQVPTRASLKLRPPARPVVPTIPYLGTFLTDLIMLDTALPDFVEGNLINFEKRRKEATILFLIRQLQESCQGYNLHPNLSFCKIFLQHPQLSEEQSYRISRIIEPPADSCPNSPKLHRSLTKRFSSLLLGTESSAPPPGPEKSGISPLGSCSSLETEDVSSAPCSPTWGSPTVKNLPASQSRACPLLELSLPSPTLKQRGTEARIIRVSMDNEHGNGNLYRSILITSQDKTTAVVQRALQKHNLEGDTPSDYRLLQLLEDGQELLIPDGANAFYAMNPSSPHDFFLCHKKGTTKPPVLGVTQACRKTTSHSTLTLKDCSTRVLSTTSCPTSSSSAPHLVTPRVCPSLPVMEPQLRPNFLAPPFPPSPSWFLGIQHPSVSVDSPLPSPTLPLPHHLETTGAFESTSPDTSLSSSLQSPQAMASMPQSLPCYSLGPCFWSESPNHSSVHHFSAL
ncbi:ral guanine nucleotide dissociation stimulator-like 3 [Sceloporus undulatus]|uniref:ral guanine nucleotide dissociation stimulator-like 3 n=1 Tax=Sceloporus undulatus TaxID=8520 RepID=UPI001C4BABB9|nr:ral guanine nucleotide dissociation stimulator-like 3 [Sceloporus undulatus]